MAVESQQDIDALLAEVNALAEEAVATIGEEEAAETARAAAPTGAAAASAGASASPAGSDPRRGARVITAGNAAPAPEDLNRILNIEVPIIVQLSERTMPMSEILSLTTGAIIEFEKPADSELDLMINNKRIGSGQAVKVGENFGLRVVWVGSVRDRIQAMGTH